MKEDRPNVPEISQDPAAAGQKTVNYDLQPGECGFHHAMVWHASTPNTSSSVRRAFIIRYVAEGTIWLGSERFPYDEVGIAPGEPIGGPHFPMISTSF
jgi:ectoine hydroxylase-related dioxygenase (phytanoyl-CoA dioxygenase family)